MQGKIKFTVGNLFTAAVLLMMFLGAIDFINRFFVFVFVAAILFFITPSRKIVFDASFFVLLAFSVSLMVFDSDYQSGILNILKAFVFPLCYIVGRCLYLNLDSGNNDLIAHEKRMSKVVYIVAIGSFGHFILNMLVNLGRTDRDVIEFWSRKDLSATGQAAFACIMIAVSAAALFSKSGILKKVFAIISLAIIVAYNFILAGRTIFVLIAIALVFAYFFRAYYHKIRIWKTVLIFVVIVALLFLLYSIDFLNIKTLFEQSNFYERFFSGDYTQEIDEDSRLEYKLYYIEHFFDHMLGGNKIQNDIVGHHAHDLYLDTYDDAGIFALLAIVAYIIMSLYRAIKCARNRKISFQTKQMILCVVLILNIQFWLEPIIQGMPWLLASYCFIDGALGNLLTKSKDQL